MCFSDFPFTGVEFVHWRQRMGWTQQQAAASLYMSSMTIDAYESGKLPIPPVVAMAACWLAEELRRPAQGSERARAV
jgi:transcriptional regulator with XRE-family HTH domain